MMLHHRFPNLSKLFYWDLAGKIRKEMCLWISLMHKSVIAENTWEISQMSDAHLVENAWHTLWFPNQFHIIWHLIWWKSNQVQKFWSLSLFSELIGIRSLIKIYLANYIFCRKSNFVVKWKNWLYISNNTLWIYLIRGSCSTMNNPPPP